MEKATFTSAGTLIEKFFEKNAGNFGGFVQEVKDRNASYKPHNKCFELAEYETKLRNAVAASGFELEHQKVIAEEADPDTGLIPLNADLVEKSGEAWEKIAENLYVDILGDELNSEAKATIKDWAKQLQDLGAQSRYVPVGYA